MNRFQHTFAAFLLVVTTPIWAQENDSNEDTANTEASSQSQTLFEDKQGIIWLSCEGVGVYKIIKQDTFKLYSHPLVKSAHSLLAKDDATLIIGTAEHGIQQWNPATKQLIALDK